MTVAPYVSATNPGVGSAANIHTTAQALAEGLMGYYSSAGNGTLPAPYNWWESSGIWSSMINYWHLTGDLTYNGDVVSALTAQAGNTQDFMGQYTTGNDD